MLSAGTRRSADGLAARLDGRGDDPVVAPTTAHRRSTHPSRGVRRHGPRKADRSAQAATRELPELEGPGVRDVRRRDRAGDRVVVRVGLRRGGDGPGRRSSEGEGRRDREGGRNAASTSASGWLLRLDGSLSHAPSMSKARCWSLEHAGSPLAATTYGDSWRMSTPRATTDQCVAAEWWGESAVTPGDGSVAVLEDQAPAVGVRDRQDHWHRAGAA